ncbi:ribonuclease III [soil metagenome]
MIPKQIPLKSEELFAVAMCHRSATTNPVPESYERMEFFGDSVLGLIIAQYLYEQHQDWDQGMLSKAKSSVVQEAPLADVALKLGLDEFIKVSIGEEQTGGRKRPSILADVFEAVIGAVYLESGLEVARWFVLEQLHPYLMRISTGDVNPNDFNSKLQEVAQALWRKSPFYRVVRESGFAHEKRCEVQVVFDDEVIGEGKGRSKKEAEQEAAKDALEVIDRARRSRDQVVEDPYA